MLHGQAVEVEYVFAISYTSNSSLRSWFGGFVFDTKNGDECLIIPNNGQNIRVSFPCSRVRLR